jgi:hypothetical protein
LPGSSDEYRDSFFVSNFARRGRATLSRCAAFALIESSQETGSITPPAPSPACFNLHALPSATSSLALRFVPSSFPDTSRLGSLGRLWPARASAFQELGSSRFSEMHFPDAVDGPDTSERNLTLCPALPRFRALRRAGSGFFFFADNYAPRTVSPPATRTFCLLPFS